MWKRKVTSLLLSALLLLSPSIGFCSESRYQISESELMQLQSHLNALEQNNEMLKSILSESDEGLTKALDALMMSQKELAELRKELLTCRSETESARESLRIANAELQRASESFKASEKERDRIEGRLRTQRNIWEVLCFIACGVAVAK
jgi:DNA repair ATPase RecN